MRWPQGRGRTQASAPGQRCKNSQANWVCLQVVGLTHWRTNNSQGAKSCKTNQCDFSSSLCYQHRQTQNQNFSHPASGRTTNLPCIVTFCCCYAYAQANVYLQMCTMACTVCINVYVYTYYMYIQRERVPHCVLYFIQRYVASQICTYMHGVCSSSQKDSPGLQPNPPGATSPNKTCYILYNSSRSKVHRFLTHNQR